MKKPLKVTLITLGSIIGTAVVILGSYVSYVAITYKRIGDIDLIVNSKANKENVSTNQELKLTTFNIGFGAYSPNYTFFMDEGYDENGNPTKGKYGKGISFDDVNKNTNGAIETVKKIPSDFYCFQEVDEDSDRAYHINQKERITSSFDKYDSTYAINFDTAYLAYPFNDPHGKSKAGLLSLSSYKINKAERKEYTISTSFSKFFDLDRCFAVHTFKTDSNKDFILINSHMSAYDEGGLIRNKQIQELYSFMKTEKDKGNYVIACGDFNHDLLTNNPDYEYTKDNFAYKNQTRQRKPDWLSYMFDDNKKSPFDDGFHVYAANNNPSCRDCDVTWQEGHTFVSTVDGFIVSNNVEFESVVTTKVTDTGFGYSDHQPSTLTFRLKK